MNAGAATSSTGTASARVCGDPTGRADSRVHRLRDPLDTANVPRAMRSFPPIVLVLALSLACDGSKAPRTIDTPDSATGVARDGGDMADAPVVEHADAPTGDLRAVDASADGVDLCGEPGQSCCGGLCRNGCCANGRCVILGASCSLATPPPGQGMVCGPSGRCMGCGGPDQDCCPGDQSCVAGGCCFAGKCIAPTQNCGSGADSSGTCVSGRCTGCGSSGQRCCGPSRPTYNQISVCYETREICTDDRCAPCGEAGQPCCRQGAPAAACSIGHICSGSSAPLGTCRKCGGPGQPCCTGDLCDGSSCCLLGRCFAAGATCVGGSQTFGTCMAGRCTCGRLKEPCCPQVANAGSYDVRCIPSDTACSTPINVQGAGTCEKCGGLGESCCSAYKCNDPGAGCVRESRTSERFVCQRCGQTGQPCCPNSPECASSGDTCGSSADGIDRCQPCGRIGRRCCPGSPRCTEANSICGSDDHCQACGTPTVMAPGVPKTPCCPGNRCNQGCCVSGARDLPYCVGQGQTCFEAGPACGAGGTCGPGCGGQGQPCCTEDGLRACGASGTTCVLLGATLTCVPCGKANQPCCLGTSSAGDCEGALRCENQPGGSRCR